MFSTKAKIEILLCFFSPLVHCLARYILHLYYKITNPWFIAIGYPRKGKYYLIPKNARKYHFRTAYLVAIFNFATIFLTSHENISSFQNLFTNFDKAQFVVFKFAKKIYRGDCRKNEVFH